MAANTRRLHFPALILAGVFGLEMIFSSDPGSGNNVWGLDQTRASTALLVWIALRGVVSGLIGPDERRYGAGGGGAERKGSRAHRVRKKVVRRVRTWWSESNEK